jgi:lysophospholipase L1-like esterase
MPQPSRAERGASGTGGARPGSHVLLYAGMAVGLVLALFGLDAAVLAANNPARILSHHYYMALGDSLTFGYQPDLNFSSGFSDDIYQDLSAANVTQQINYACAGETTTTMIQGGCIARFAHHGFYTGSQLGAAEAFLKAHPGEVSPVTLEIGANDMLPDLNTSNCIASTSVTNDLNMMDDNLTKVILPQLLAALHTTSGDRAGDLVLLNYYDPFAQECPTSQAFIHTFNDHLAADAAAWRVPVVDIYAAFGGDTNMAQYICGGYTDASGQRHPYTWMCNSQFHDIHPTTYGYAVMARAVELALGMPNISPLPGIVSLDARPLARAVPHMPEALVPERRSA